MSASLVANSFLGHLVVGLMRFKSELIHDRNSTHDTHNAKHRDTQTSKQVLIAILGWEVLKQLCDEVHVSENHAAAAVPMQTKLIECLSRRIITQYETGERQTGEGQGIIRVQAQTKKNKQGFLYISNRTCGDDTDIEFE